MLAASVHLSSCPSWGVLYYYKRRQLLSDSSTDSGHAVGRAEDGHVLPTGLVRFTVLGGVGVDTELGVGAESVHLLPPGPDPVSVLVGEGFDMDYESDPHKHR